MWRGAFWNAFPQTAEPPLAEAWRHASGTKRLPNWPFGIAKEQREASGLRIPVRHPVPAGNTAIPPPGKEATSNAASGGAIGKWWAHSPEMLPELPRVYTISCRDNRHMSIGAQNCPPIGVEFCPPRCGTPPPIRPVFQRLGNYAENACACLFASREGSTSGADTHDQHQPPCHTP